MLMPRGKIKTLAMNESELAKLNDRVNKLENALIELTDFAMMATLWLSVISDEEAIALTKRWFVKQLDRILECCENSRNAREHVLRSAREFDEMNNLPSGSPVRAKLWQNIVQKLRQETEPGER